MIIGLANALLLQINKVVLGETETTAQGQTAPMVQRQDRTCVAVPKTVLSTILIYDLVQNILHGKSQGKSPFSAEDKSWEVTG